MKRYLAGSLILAMALTAACGKKKAEDKPADAAPAVKVEDKKPADGDAAAEKPVEKLLTLYPPVYNVEARSAPAEGSSLYFGVSPGTTGRNFDMVWVWIVTAFPDFDGALNPPTFNTEDEANAFMEKWAAEFAALPANVAELDKTATDFKFTVAPAFFTDTAFPIPATATADLPQWVKTTQKIFARRYRTVSAGSTTITGTFKGETLTVPVVISAYTAAQLTAGETRYNIVGTAATNGCVDCHKVANAANDAFLKHSSDYLAYATDLAISNIFTTSTYPNGALLLNGTHTKTFDAAGATAMVGYLRSLPTSLDKIFGVPVDTAATLRLTGKSKSFFRVRKP